MPQLVKKRRSGWAVLAAGAMVASLLAVGASPAAAITASDSSDAASDRTACLGPALENAGFTDVSMGGAHYDAINCIAHYGITAGTTADTFSPRASVIRSQMALFLAKMAARTGLDLDDLSDADFTDLDGLDSGRMDAINGLVNAGIMTGTGDDTFSPGNHVTRAEMALWLVSFIDAISDDVDLDPDTGLYELENAPAPHNEFEDSQVSQPIHVHRAISVAFELGITVGYSDLEFKGHRLVTRAEMATFITRTLGHTNLRPKGLTAQSSGTGTLSIQASIRSNEWEPIDNEAIEVIGSTAPDNVLFNDDRECVGRFVAHVLFDNPACEIDAGDYLTGTDGNVVFAPVTAESISPESSTISCGTDDGAGTYTVGAPVGTMADARFWAWNDDYGEIVDEGTDLVPVVHVAPFSRTPGVEADHAKASGGLDIMKNQHEAPMGSEVTYTVQLHGLAADGTHVNTGPNKTGNYFNVVISKFNVLYETVQQDHDDDPTTAEIDVRQRDDGDADAPGLQAQKRSVQPFERLRSEKKPEADGSISIPVTIDDPSRRVNNDDVIVEIVITPVDDVKKNDLLIQEGLNWDSNEDDTVDADDENGFFDSVVFSDDGVDQTRIHISAATMPAYREAPASGRSRPGAVTVTVIDQYGRPVKGQGVHAVSNAPGTESNASPDNTLRFQNWYVTGTNGMHTISYSYRGGIRIEELTIINTGTPRTIDPVAVVDSDVPGATQDNFDAQRLPAASASLYWVVDGVQPTGEYIAIGDNDPEEGDYLVIDTANNTLVVYQAAAEDIAGTPRNEAQVSGPHQYFWDASDRFTVGGNTVTMEQFEAIVGGGTDDNKVSVGNISWENYQYFTWGTRTRWMVQASCAQGVPTDN